MRDNTARRLSRLHVIVYRLTGGVLGRRLVGNDMLLLTTRGCATGKAHTVPLLYLRDGDTLVVVASWGGRPRDPDWYRNLVAEPRAIVQVRSRTWGVRARTANTEEREAWWPRIVAAYGGYRIYQSHTDRTIPVVLLEPIPAPPRPIGGGPSRRQPRPGERLWLCTGCAQRQERTRSQDARITLSYCAGGCLLAAVSLAPARPG